MKLGMNIYDIGCSSTSDFLIPVRARRWIADDRELESVSYVNSIILKFTLKK
jgi:hypothetical protein